MKPTKRSEKTTAEMRVYELLGIRLFRRLVFLVERIRHCKDGGRNENYHVQDTSRTALIRFSGYLWYNAMFHVISLLLTAVYVVLSRCFSAVNLAVDMVMILVAVLNGYCLMLQRYIYLKVRGHVAKKQGMAVKARTCRVAEIVTRLRGKAPEDVEREVVFLKTLRDTVAAGNDVVLTADDEQVLSAIAAVCGETGGRAVHDSSAKTVTELMAGLPEKHVISKVKRRVQRLQTVLRVKKQNTVMFGILVTTATPAMEEAYRTVFPAPTWDAMLETIDILLASYEEVSR